MSAHPSGLKKGSRPITRREFLSWTWWGIAGLIMLESTLGLVWSLWPKKRKAKPGEFGSFVVVDRNAADFEVGGTPYLVAKGRFFVNRVPDGYLALYRRCTHLGCPVPWSPDEPSLDELAEKGQFHCRCHGSLYDRYGVNKGGPTPRPLDLMDFTIEPDGTIIVDTTKIRQRSSYSPSQVVKV
jgi:cytochrome b6-f complex iron-sulfur subunit